MKVLFFYILIPLIFVTYMLMRLFPDEHDSVKVALFSAFLIEISAFIWLLLNSTPPA